MKDPVEIRLPTRNHVFVIPRVEKSTEPVAPALFQDLPLYFCDGPTIQTVVSE